MVWQIVNKVDTETAKKVPLFIRTPFIEMEGLYTPKNIEEAYEFAKKNGIEGMESMIETVKFTKELPGPRVIKTHLPFEFLPPKLLDTCKVIFVCRNPKDACVSFYHHHNNFPEYKFKGNFEEFAKCYREGNLEYGSYWTMLKVISHNIWDFCRNYHANEGTHLLHSHTDNLSLRLSASVAIKEWLSYNS